MPPPTLPPKKLLEEIILEALHFQYIIGTPDTLKRFVQLSCSPQEMALLVSYEKIQERAEEMLKVTANGALIRGICTLVIRKVLELAAEKAQLDCIYGITDPKPVVARSYSFSNAKEDYIITINKQSILDIEKLFI